MNALSLDLRHRVVAAVDSGISQSEAARRFAVSRTSVVRLLARRRDSGTLAAKPRPGAAPRISPEQHAVLAAQMRAHPQAGLQEHCRIWQQDHGTVLHASTLWRTLKRMGWSHKKRACEPVSAMRRADRSGKTRSAR